MYCAVARNNKAMHIYALKADNLPGKSSQPSLNYRAPKRVSSFTFADLPNDSSSKMPVLISVESHLTELSDHVLAGLASAEAELTRAHEIAAARYGKDDRGTQSDLQLYAVAFGCIVNCMYGTFGGAFAFNSELAWDTSKVTQMYGTFRDTEAFNQPLAWDTSKVMGMDYTFRDARAFNSELAWDTSKVTSMQGAFEEATLLVNGYNS